MWSGPKLRLPARWLNSNPTFTHSLKLELAVQPLFIFLSTFQPLSSTCLTRAYLTSPTLPQNYFWIKGKGRRKRTVGGGKKRGKRPVCKMGYCAVSVAQVTTLETPGDTSCVLRVKAWKEYCVWERTPYLESRGWILDLTQLLAGPEPCQLSGSCFLQGNRR